MPDQDFAGLGGSVKYLRTRVNYDRYWRLPANFILNIGGEASKSGCTPEELPALAQAVTQLPGLRLRGLMTIPEPSDDPQAQRAPLARLRQLRDQLHADLDTLSMGMSQDLEAAIAEGATWVRIGTALFGARDYGSPSL